MPLDDPDLQVVLELQRGSDEALNELMRRHEGALYRFIFRYLRHEDTARDVLQESFVRVFFKKEQFRPTAKFSTWLYRIALNLCRDHVRSRQARKGKQTESLTMDSNSGQDKDRDFATAEPTPSEAAEQNEALAQLETHIQALPHDLKAAFILAAIEERPHKECSQLLGISSKAVETRVYRARKALAAKIFPQR